MHQSGRYLAVIILLPLFMSGCMTLEGPDHKYVLTNGGFKEVPKAETIENGATAEQSATTSTVTRTTTASSTDSPNNRAAAWGVARQSGRGPEPSPMRSFEFIYSRSIDSTYLLLKKEFGFISLDDLSNNTFYQSYVKDKALLHLRYEAKPGAYYKMRNWVYHPSAGEEPSNTVQIELAKEGSNKVLIQVSYYSGNTHNPGAYESSLKSRIAQALK